MDAVDLNGCHEGADIYIVGAGPQLNALSGGQRRFLADQITIGLNRTQYFQPLSYFLSAYFSECLLALKRRNCGVTIHARPIHAPPLHPDLLAIRRMEIGEHCDLPRMLDAASPTLFTLRNAAIMATHLAFVLGARRIFFVGVEQNNSLHYYNHQEDVRDRIIADLDDMYRSGLWQNPDHGYASYESLREGLLVSAATRAAETFYMEDHAPTFRRVFEALGACDVDVFSTTRDSVIARAGATVMPLPSASDERRWYQRIFIPEGR